MGIAHDWPFDTPPRDQLTADQLAQLQFLELAALEGCKIYGVNLVERPDQRPFENLGPGPGSYYVLTGTTGRGASLIYCGGSRWKIHRGEEASAYFDDFHSSTEALMAYIRHGDWPWKCPSCGKSLRTNLAKQCFECGASWHGGKPHEMDDRETRGQ
jgi:hypothetical protein